MRLISWNVNGLRAAVKKGFEEVFETLDADVFALQETKLQEGQIDLSFAGYESYWNYAEKKGYSGTAVFTRQAPRRVIRSFGIDHLDHEGRLLALEFDEFWFVDVYTPNAQPELARLGFRMEWDDSFRDFCVNLNLGQLPDGATIDPKPVVMCGDFNVAHEEIDLKNPGPNRGHPGFSDEERAKFTELLDAGFADTFRRTHPDLAGAYTWWSYRGRARANNTGWRIDYFLTSEDLFSKVEQASIYAEVMGSDHCPVGLDLALS